MRVKSFDIDGYFERVYEELEQLCQLYGDYGLIDTYILPFLSRSMNDIKKNPDKNLYMAWSDESNRRYGYKTSTIGMLGEGIVMFILLPYCTDIRIIQERTTQSTLGMDLITSIGTIQCKVIRFQGRSVLIRDDMYNHCADFTSLTDIDDGITFILPRQAFYQEERVTKTYLEKECILCVRHDQLTPLINRLDQVQQTKYERLQLVEIPV